MSAGTSRQLLKEECIMTYRYNLYLEIAKRWLAIAMAIALILAVGGGISHNVFSESTARIIVLTMVAINAVPVAICLYFLWKTDRLDRQKLNRRRR
jgi:hypothetical protein